MGYQQQLVESLTMVQSNFDISGNQGIPQALNNLLQSFSAWGATPDNQAARQTVVQRATDLAQSFQQSSVNLSAQARDTEQQIGQTVDQVNQLVGEIQGYNHIAMQGNKSDSGLNARMHAALDELATLADVNATFQSDGTVSLMLNGETPLLLEDKQFTISSSLYQPQEPPPTNANGPANIRIQGSDGSDITSKTTGAQLGALLHLRNQILPSFIGDAYQARRPEHNGKAIGRPGQSALDIGKHNGRSSGAGRRPALHLQHQRCHSNGRLALRGSQRHAGPAGGDQSGSADGVQWSAARFVGFGQPGR